MTDNEIIKALECLTGIKKLCKECPYVKTGHYHFCRENCAKDALDLINRLQADKDALIAGQKTLQKYIAKQKAEIEALKRDNIVLRDVIDARDTKIEMLQQETLGSVKPGDIVTIGEREYIVLGHGEETTAIIAKKPIKAMAFGEDSDYTKSYVRKYCNDEFYKELCKTVGKHNIIPHTVNLVSDDGSNKGATVKDNISILTCDLYRRYREFLPAIGSTYWTATRVTTLNKSYAHRVCIVSALGIFSWEKCAYSRGVRPFCILNSSIKCNKN